MAWIESHQTLAHHPKTLRLASELRCGVPCAIGYLHLLWYWALDYAPNGIVSAADKGAVATACMWSKRSEQFWAALLSAGFVDVEDGDEVLHIHDWMDYAGKLVEQRALRKESNRRAQSRRRQRHVSTQSALSQQEVSAESAPNQHPTVPDRTGPNQTEPPVPPQRVSADAEPMTPTDTIECYGCQQTVDTMDYKTQHEPGCEYFGLYPLEIRSRRGLLNERAKREATRREPVTVESRD